MEINNDSNLTAKLFSIAKNIINQNSELKIEENNKISETNQNISEFNLTNEENLKLILSTIGISPSEKNLSIVKLLLNSSLPVNKENLNEVSNNLSLFNKLPFEKIEILLKNNLELNKTNASQLEGYLSKEINLTNQINELFSSIDNSKDLKNIIKIFTNDQNLANSSEIIFNKLTNIKTELSSALSKKTDAFNELLNKLEQLKTSNNDFPKNFEKDFPILKKILENSNFKNLTEPKENLTKSKENLNTKNLIESILPNKIMFNKNSLLSFENILKQTFSSNYNFKNTDNNPFFNIEKDILKLIFKEFNIKEFKEFIPKVHTFQTKLNKEISFDFKNSNSKDLNEFLFNIKENINLSKTILEKNELYDTNNISKNIDNINKNIDFMSALKDTTFLQIPLNINNHQTNAELFVFKDKKKAKNKNKNCGSALISLNLANLGNIETYINKIDNNISCQFRLEDKKIKNFIKENINLLNLYLKEKNLILKEVSFKEINESFSLISPEPNKAQDKFNLGTFNKQA